MGEEIKRVGVYSVKGIWLRGSGFYYFIDNTITGKNETSYPDMYHVDRWLKKQAEAKR